MVQAYYQEMLKAKDEGALDDKVGSLFMRASRAKLFHSRRFERNQKNWRYYLALDPEYGYGQYTLKHIAWMKAQGRSISTYNICKSYCDQIAGGIMQSPFDPEFYPVGDEMSTLTEAAKNAMYSDKELCDWGTAYFELVRAGLIHEGVIKMTTTDKYHPLGNIAMSYVLPLHWYSDPMWVSIHTKDCRQCWEEFYLMPEQLLELYGERMSRRNNGEGKPELDSLLKTYKNRLVEYGTPGGPTPFVGDEFSWGSALKCIAEYRMRREKYTSVIYEGPEGDVEIPELADDQARIEWLQQRFGFEQWDPNAVKEYESSKSLSYKEVICPSLTWGDIIDDAPTEVQIDQIPFFVWSSDRVNGEAHGIIDLLADSQDDINDANAMIKYKMQTEGGGGGQFVDESGFETPEACEDYIKHRNDPAKTWKTAPGLMIRNGQIPARPIIVSQFPVEAYKRLEAILNVMLPQMSKVVPATRGQAEGSSESGYAYNLKKIQADQALYTMHYMLRQFWNQVYEGYLLQAAQQYSLGGVSRKFTSQGGKRGATFNERIKLPDGSIGLKNDAAMLRTIRHKIIISETQDTPTKRTEDMRLLTDYLRAIAPFSATKPLTISYLSTRIASLIDPLSSEDKEALKEIGAQEVENGLLRLQLEKMNLEMQIQQLQNPPMLPGAPQAPEAAPAPAEAAPLEQSAQPITEAAPQVPQGV